MPLFDAQAWFVRDIITGKRKLPAKEERLADQKMWREKLAAAEATKDVENIIRF